MARGHVDVFCSLPKGFLTIYEMTHLVTCFLHFFIQPDMKDSVSQFMSGVHQSVNRMSITYLQNERRYNYTTPKSFLEQIKLYQNLLGRKHRDLLASMNRLENGLEKLESTAQQVSCAARSLDTFSIFDAKRKTQQKTLVSLDTTETNNSPVCVCTQNTGDMDKHKRKCKTLCFILGFCICRAFAKGVECLIHTGRATRINGARSHSDACYVMHCLVRAAWTVL